MKKLLSKPGFEGIFALSLIAIIGLPPLVFGQPKKDDKVVTKRLEIKINGGDTVINGKNLKDLKGKEREEALGLLMPRPDFLIRTTPKDCQAKKRIIIKRRDNTDGKDVLIEREFNLNDGDFHLYADVDRLGNDSTGSIANLHIKKFRGGKDMAFRFEDDDRLPEVPTMRRFTLRGPIDGAGSRNTQSFNYNNTDSEGISTHVSYRVNEASKENLSSIGGIDKATLELKDINLSPEFSTGKTTLTFNLPAKTTAEVQFKDSQGKVLWADKTTNGAFSKSFSLGLNGAYYLQVKQAGNTALKRIVKED